MQNDSGFSLFELLTTIAIIGIVSAIAIPNFIAWRTRARLGDGAHDVYAAFQKAKSQAAKENAAVTVSFAPNGGLDGDYQLFLDNGEGTGDADSDGIPDGLDNGVRDGTEPILSNHQLPGGVTLAATTFGGHTMVYDINGIPDASGQVRLSITTGDVRQISVGPTGVVTIEYP